MTVEMNEISEKSLGGTELMAARINQTLPKELLQEFQIIPSRVRNLDESKIRILYCHDLPHDPESKHLENEGWRKFHKIVFVSYWQRDWYVRHFQIPFSRTHVMHNAITPIEAAEKPKGKINLIYHTTPHRGLELLVPVFDHLAKSDPDIHLDVFSSFQIYGWEQRDAPYKPLFDAIKDHPQMTFHGFQPNDVVRKALQKAHIFAYPNIWMETSCLAMMEAISAKCMCVHPDFGALPETTSNWTFMYPFHEDPNAHAGIFLNALKSVIDIAREKDESQELKLSGAKTYCDLFYNWEVRAEQWQAFLTSLLHLPRELDKPKAMFHYRAS
jgi:UDP-glucose:(glucosyl)LPS alpha-1,2-glucosyltransferase